MCGMLQVAAIVSTEASFHLVAHDLQDCVFFHTSYVSLTNESNTIAIRKESYQHCSINIQTLIGFAE